MSMSEPNPSTLRLRKISSSIAAASSSGTAGFTRKNLREK